MNERQLENKVRQDAANVKKGLNVLVADSSAHLGKLDENLGQVADHVTTWVEDSVSQVSAGVEKMTGEAKDNLVSAAATVKKDVSHGLSQYNQKAQHLQIKSRAISENRLPDTPGWRYQSPCCLVCCWAACSDPPGNLFRSTQFKAFHKGVKR